MFEILRKLLMTAGVIFVGIATNNDNYLTAVFGISVCVFSVVAYAYSHPFTVMGDGTLVCVYVCMCCM